MKPIPITTSETDGFKTLQITNGLITLKIIPGLGGKISSLRDERNKREWLWRNPRMKYQTLPYGSSYVALADTGGWDECFPTVAACAYPSAPWKGTAIQDHGELWSQGPECNITQSAGDMIIRTLWHGIALPYAFERIITMPAKDARLQFAYTVTNTGDTPLDWIWSSHPLLAIEPGMRLLVPASARFYLGGAFPAGLVTQERGLSFPLTAGKIDLTTLPKTDAGMAMKLWSEPLSEGWATMRAADGELRMRWDVTQLPQLGIWMNLGMWAGDGGKPPYYNLGLEPCIGAQDSLADAVTKYKMFETLAPNNTRTWGLDVEIATLAL